MLRFGYWFIVRFLRPATLCRPIRGFEISAFFLHGLTPAATIWRPCRGSKSILPLAMIHT
ncbi:MAG: hypothetical protein B6D36_06405 [Planctomycetes bacterium UTPLA1]|nr:MAG: hypothetical protein B6D36_06405 [Planctomycetes bacterium UTPLA1]